MSAGRTAITRYRNRAHASRDPGSAMSHRDAGAERLAALGGTFLAALGLGGDADDAGAITRALGDDGLFVKTEDVVLGAALQPFLPGFGLELACAVSVCAYLAANYNAPLAGVALAVEWGGAALLHSVWPAVIVAAWIGSGMANAPAKRRQTSMRPPRPLPARTLAP